MRKSKIPAVLLKFVSSLLLIGAILGALVIFGTIIARKRFHDNRIVDIGDLYFDIRRHGQLITLDWADEKNRLPIFSCLEGERLRKSVKISNYSPYIVESALTKRPFRSGINIGYKIKNSQSGEYLPDEPRFLISAPLQPANDPKEPVSKEETIEIRCPEYSGQYDIQVEFVQEDTAWHHQVIEEVRWAKARIDVLSAKAVEDLPRTKYFRAQDFSFLRTIPWLSQEKRKILTAAYRIAVRTLLATVSEVEQNNNVYPVFDAGTLYPMLWVRDMATIQRALKFLNPVREFFQNHWSDLFLMVQKPDGELFDWVSPLKRTAGHFWWKNTIQSDQELWVIVSALEAIKEGYLNRHWLQVKINEQGTRGQALGGALKWVLHNRWDEQFQCLKSGHVVDWGDVGLTGKNSETATSIENAHPFVCGIFLQTLLFQTIKLMKEYLPEELNSVLGLKSPGSVNALMNAIRKTARSLWSERYGYFTIHRHIEPFQHLFDEEALFPLGGNVLTIESGLASEYQKQRILDVIIKRQKIYNVSTVGGVLLPSYPADTFEHPDMNEPYEYQNGGQWDWYGARAALLLMAKSKALGYEKLYEIATKVYRSGGFYEWDTLQGISRGSRHYRAGAAAFIYAVHMSFRQ